MKLKLVEPLKFLFKDEVRKLGLELKLSKDIISRHPFPGPGLAIRMPGSITNEKIKVLKEADYLFINELKKTNLYHKIWQAYAALLPVKTVGVMGDNRTYEHICLLRAITSEDGMTADFYNFDKKFLQTISNKIINNIVDIAMKKDGLGAFGLLSFYNSEPETIKRQLYKNTSIESSFGFNTLAIVDNKPKIFNLKDL